MRPLLAVTTNRGPERTTHLVNPRYITRVTYCHDRPALFIHINEGATGLWLSAEFDTYADRDRFAEQLTDPERSTTNAN